MPHPTPGDYQQALAPYGAWVDDAGYVEGGLGDHPQPTFLQHTRFLTDPRAERLTLPGLKRQRGAETGRLHRPLRVPSHNRDA